MSNRKNNCNLPVFESDKQLADFLSKSLAESMQQFIRHSIKTMIKEEMTAYKKEVSDLIGALHFNGYYSRHLQSTFGEVRDIPVPRFRDNPQDFTPRSLGVFEGKKGEMEKLIANMHLQGISQRKVAGLVKQVYGIRISKNRVGSIHRQLAEAEEAQINSQRIEEEYEHIMLDGIWGKAKGYGWESNKAVILCVLGIKTNGERKILGFRVARSESYEEWYELILGLKQRGLKTSKIKLAITDDTDGLTKAIKHLLPKLPIQHCIVHKMRNVIGKTSHKHKKQMAADIKDVYQTQNKKQAVIKAKTVAKKWHLKEPKAVNSLKHHFSYTVTYLDFPKRIHKKIRTTNMLEREFREVRRRIKVFDSSFHDTDSMGRYANSIMNYLNKNYPAARSSLHTNG
jgi:putative transposase